MLGQLFLGILKGSGARLGVGGDAGDSQHAGGKRAVVVLLDEQAKLHLHMQAV